MFIFLWEGFVPPMKWFQFGPWEGWEGVTLCHRATFLLYCIQTFRWDELKLNQRPLCAPPWGVGRVKKWGGGVRWLGKITAFSSSPVKGLCWFYGPWENMIGFCISLGTSIHAYNTHSTTTWKHHRKPKPSGSAHTWNRCLGGSLAYAPASLAQLLSNLNWNLVGFQQPLSSCHANRD